MLTVSRACRPLAESDPYVKLIGLPDTKVVERDELNLDSSGGHVRHSVVTTSMSAIEVLRARLNGVGGVPMSTLL
jgi:hypothetical protein